MILTDISVVEGARHNHPLGLPVDLSIFVECIMGSMKEVEPSTSQHLIDEGVGGTPSTWKRMYLSPAKNCGTQVL